MYIEPGRITRVSLRKMNVQYKTIINAWIANKLRTLCYIIIIILI